MRMNSVESGKLRLLATVMGLALLGACSSDVMRFDDPLGNPYKSRGAYDPVSTNSINRQRTSQAQLAPVPAAAVTTQALPAPSRPMISGTNPGAIAPSPRGPVNTGSVASANYPPLAPLRQQPSVVGASQGWTAVGGTPVTLGQGESLNTVSARYGVPVSAIMAVNGYSQVNQAQPGQQIIIPAYNPAHATRQPPTPTTTSSVIQRAPLPTPVPAPAVQPIPRAVSNAMLPSKAAPAVQAIPAAPAAKVASNARQVMPQAETDAEKRAAAKLRELKTAPSPTDEVKKRAEEAKKRAAAEAEAQKKIAAAKAETQRNAARKIKASDDDVQTTASIPEQRLPARSEPLKTPATVQATAEPQKESPAAEANEESSFRWPAKGRVISGFGARGTGGANDGINIALPEGTPVRAAEGGTVVHADDALKGYGKLVLIRHPNGYVSVYAHNGELNVKRGESVKRGQVIAKSGQTGNVTAPQLHFELRKGSTPVDPTKYLAGN